MQTKSKPYVPDLIFGPKGDMCHIGHENTRTHYDTIKSFLIFAQKAIHFLYRLFQNQPISSRNRLCIYPNTWVIFLQIFAIKCTEKFFSFQSLQNVCIPRNTSTNLVGPLPCWRPFTEFGIFCSYRQD